MWCPVRIPQFLATFAKNRSVFMKSSSHQLAFFWNYNTHINYCILCIWAFESSPILIDDNIHLTQLSMHIIIPVI